MSFAICSLMLSVKLRLTPGTDFPLYRTPCLSIPFQSTKRVSEILNKYLSVLSSNIVKLFGSLKICIFSKDHPNLYVPKNHIRCACMYLNCLSANRLLNGTCRDWRCYTYIHMYISYQLLCFANF